MVQVLEVSIIVSEVLFVDTYCVNVVIASL